MNRKEDIIFVLKVLFVLFATGTNGVLIYQNYQAKQKQTTQISQIVNVYTNRISVVEHFLQDIQTNLPSIIKHYIHESPSTIQNLIIDDSNKISSTNNHSDIIKESKLSSIPYIFFVHNGNLSIRYYGRNFSVGSPFGSLDKRIVSIFPDRINLSDGTVLMNSHNPDSSYFEKSTFVKDLQ